MAYTISKPGTTTNTTENSNVLSDKNISSNLVSSVKKTDEKTTYTSQYDRAEPNDALKAITLLLEEERVAVAPIEPTNIDLNPKYPHNGTPATWYDILQMIIMFNEDDNVSGQYTLNSVVTCGTTIRNDETNNIFDLYKLPTYAQISNNGHAVTFNCTNIGTKSASFLINSKRYKLNDPVALCDIILQTDMTGEQRYWNYTHPSIQKINIEYHDIHIQLGDGVDDSSLLRYEIVPLNAYNPQLYISCNPSSIASYDQKTHMVKGTMPGDSSIIFFSKTSPDVSTYCNVYVRAILVSEINITADYWAGTDPDITTETINNEEYTIYTYKSVDIEYTGNFKLSYEVYPENAQNKHIDIEYNHNILQMDKRGTFTVSSDGSAAESVIVKLKSTDGGNVISQFTVNVEKKPIQKANISSYINPNKILFGETSEITISAVSMENDAVYDILQNVTYTAYTVNDDGNAIKFSGTEIVEGTQESGNVAHNGTAAITPVCTITPNISGATITTGGTCGNAVTGKCTIVVNAEGNEYFNSYQNQFILTVWKEVEPEITKYDVVVAISQTSLNIGEIAEIQALSYDKLPYDGNINIDITNSGNSNAVSIHHNGIIANAVGSATIMVYGAETENFYGFSQTFNVTVYSYIPVVRFDIIPGEMTLNVNENRNFEWTLYPNNATDKSITILYEPENIATVNTQDHRITGIAEGDTTVILCSNDSRIDATAEDTSTNFNIIAPINVHVISVPIYNPFTYSSIYQAFKKADLNPKPKDTEIRKIYDNNDAHYVYSEDYKIGYESEPTKDDIILVDVNTSTTTLNITVGEENYFGCIFWTRPIDGGIDNFDIEYMMSDQTMVDWEIIAGMTLNDTKNQVKIFKCVGKKEGTLKFKYRPLYRNASYSECVINVNPYVEEVIEIPEKCIYTDKYEVTSGSKSLEAYEYGTSAQYNFTISIIVREGGNPYKQNPVYIFEPVNSNLIKGAGNSNIDLTFNDANTLTFDINTPSDDIESEENRSHVYSYTIYPTSANNDITTRSGGFKCYSTNVITFGNAGFTLWSQKPPKYKIYLKQYTTEDIHNYVKGFRITSDGLTYDTYGTDVTLTGDGGKYFILTGATNNNVPPVVSVYLTSVSENPASTMDTPGTITASIAKQTGATTWEDIQSVSITGYNGVSMSSGVLFGAYCGGGGGGGRGGSSSSSNNTSAGGSCGTSTDNNNNNVTGTSGSTSTTTESTTNIWEAQSVCSIWNTSIIFKLTWSFTYIGNNVEPDPAETDGNNANCRVTFTFNKINSVYTYTNVQLYCNGTSVGNTSPIGVTSGSFNRIIDAVIPYSAQTVATDNMELTAYKIDTTNGQGYTDGTISLCKFTWTHQTSINKTVNID